MEFAENTHQAASSRIGASTSIVSSARRDSLGTETAVLGIE
ncbi:hypothetical protein [Leucobacter soli]